MREKLWDAVESYFGETLVPSDPALDAALAASDAAGLPPIGVAPSHGKLLQLLARLQSARKSWRSARSAATAPSGWRALCRPAGA